MGPVRYWLRVTVRRRIASYLLLVVLLAVTSGLAMGAISAARRTQSAFPRYLHGAGAPDLVVQPYSLGSFQSNAYSTALGRRFARLADVRGVGVATGVLVAPIKRNGAPLLSDNRVTQIGSVNGLYFHQDQVIVTRGRLADPSRPGEFVANADAARLLGLRVGQTVPLAAYTVAQTAEPGFGSPAVKPASRLRARLVGIVEFDSQIAHDDVDRYPTSLLFTPALTRMLVRDHSAWVPTYALQLAHGGADVAKVEREVARTLPANTVYNFHVTSVVTEQVEGALKPETIAVAVFGLIAGIAALVITSQAIGRTLRTHARDSEVLRALGASPNGTVAMSTIGIIASVTLGAVLGAILAIVVSPIAPFGIVHALGHGSLRVDTTVILIGTATAIVALSAVAVLQSRRLSAYQRSRPGRAGAQRANAADLLARARFPLPMVVGTRFVFESGRRRAIAPVRSALLGTTLAVSVVVATVTFGASLATLVTHPRLYGWNWSYQMQDVSGSNVSPHARALLDRSKVVAAWTGYDFAGVQLDGVTTPVLITDSHPAVFPPMIAGHPLRSAHQIVLGPDTLAALHKRVGDTVTLTYGSRRDAPVYVGPTRLRIVGTASLPAIGASGTLHTSLGEGAVFSRGVEPAAFRAALTDPDPALNGPGTVAIRLRPGVSAARGDRALRRLAHDATVALNGDPNASGNRYTILAAQRPAEVVNYQQAESTSDFLAVWLSVGAALALSLALAASIRSRRHDLAMLKTLGFTRRQLASTVSWQATTAVGIGLLIGTPAGVLLGRWLWLDFARDISAVPHPTIPLLAIVAIAVVALVLANIAAAGPAISARHIRPTTILNAE